MTAGMKRLGSRWALALASAALFAGYSAFPNLAFVAYIALVPWILLYTDRRSPRISHAYFILASWLAWVFTYRQAWQYGWHAGPVMGLFCVPTWWPFSWAMSRIHRRWNLPRTVTVPIVWVTIEWLRAEFSVAHFDLYGIAYSQARFTPLIQIADLTGVYGIVFLVAAVNGWIADVLFGLRDAGWRWAAGAWRRRAAFSGASLAAVFAAVTVYGYARLATISLEEGPRLAVVQPNVRHTLRNAVGVHLTQILLTERSVEPGSADLIVWPENAVIDDLERPGAYLEDIRWLLNRKGGLLLVGANGTVPGRPGKTANSAFLVDTDGAILGRYDKQVLFPFSEYVPNDEVFGSISPRLQRIQRGLIRAGWGFLASGVHGEAMTLLRFPWNGAVLPFAALICVENTYPPVPAEAGRRGARFFVNLTSEGEVGGVVQEQLLRICIFRAVENRLAYVRCGNTGISGFIDPLGRVRSILRGPRGGTISVAGELTDRVMLSRAGPTPYARSRDLFALACVAATSLLVAGTIVARRRAAVTLVGAALVSALTACGGPPQPGTDPSRAREALSDGLELLRDGDPARAATAFAAACADAAACREALAPAVAAFRAARSDEDAADFFGAVARRHPGLASDALAGRAYFLERAGDPTAALAVLREALRIEASAANHARIGLLLAKMGHHEDALAALWEADRLAPGNVRVLEQIARTLWRSGRTAEARAVLENALAARPDAASAWAALGLLRLGEGEVEPAVEGLRKALTADPGNLEARLGLARVSLRGGRLAEVDAILAEVVAIEARLGRGPRED